MWPMALKTACKYLCGTAWYRHAEPLLAAATIRPGCDDRDLSVHRRSYFPRTESGTEQEAVRSRYGRGIVLVFLYVVIPALH